MKNEMEEIDKLIKDTLSKEETKFYDKLEEQNLLESVFGLYKGKNAWLNIFLNIVTVIFFVALIYCGIQFFKAESAIELTKWGIGSLALLINMCMLKLYSWMQMDKHAILREMKRLELQIMSLSGKVDI